jgi:hypothetical protein
MDCVTVVELFYTAEQETVTEFKVSVSVLASGRLVIIIATQFLQALNSTLVSLSSL